MHQRMETDLQKMVEMTIDYRVIRQLRNAYHNDHNIIAGDLNLPGIQWIYSNELPGVLTPSNTNLTRVEEKLIE